MKYPPKNPNIHNYDPEEDRREVPCVVEHPGADDALPYYIRFPELQRRLGISRSTIYLYIATKRLPPPVRIGPRVSVWDAKEVARYMARSEEVESVAPRARRKRRVVAR